MWDWGEWEGGDQSFSSLIGKVVICLVDFKLPLILCHSQVKMSSFLADEWWSANWGCHQEIRNVSKLYIFNMLHQTLFKFNNLKKMFQLFSFLNKKCFLKYLLFTNCACFIHDACMKVWPRLMKNYHFYSGGESSWWHEERLRHEALVSVVTLHPPVSPTAAWYILTASDQPDPAQHSCFVATAW